MSDVRSAMATVQYTPSGTAWVEAGQGEPVVLVHGVGMNRAVWGPQIEALAPGYRVIAYDMLGHGDSPLPSASVALTELSEQLGELLDTLGVEQAHLMGHSMGGLVALDFALRARRRVSDLVVLNGVYERSDEQRAAVLERARELSETDMTASEDTVEATLERWFGPHGQVTASGQVEQVRHWLEQVDRQGYARVYGCFARADRAISGRLAALAPPALFMTGEFDPNSTPAMARRMAEESPSGEAWIVPDERHMMAFAAPASVNPLLERFLRQGYATDGAAARGGLTEEGGA